MFPNLISFQVDLVNLLLKYSLTILFKTSSFSHNYPKISTLCALSEQLEEILSHLFFICKVANRVLSTYDK